MLPRMFERDGFNVTFNTTENCNLRCTYCYEINKKNKHLDIAKAKKFIDLLIKEDDPCGLDSDPTWKDSLKNKGITLDFIGGDSFMNVELLDQILTYWVQQVNLIDNERTRNWKNNWKASITTNGTLFSLQEVRDFCMKWKRVLSPGISIDGCPEIHDKCRIFPDGRGSMNEILKNWNWYKTNFPREAESTKATCAKASIPYLYDSLVFMHEKLGLTHINQNFIMEDTGCTSEDYNLLEEQLKKCADYCLEHRHELYWGILSNDFATAHRSQGLDWDERGHCGSGAMPCLSVDGDIYPCFRWLPHTQHKEKVLCVGNVEEGFNHKENFYVVRHGSCRANCTKEQKCRECEYESACSYCIAGCYVENGDFIRTTHICEITKIQVKWARYYWSKYYELEGLPFDGDWAKLANDNKSIINT